MAKYQEKKIYIYNRFASLATNDQTDTTISLPQTLFNTINCEEAPNRTNLPPSIFVCGMLDCIDFRNKLVSLVGSENFFCKSSTNDLKIQTSGKRFSQDHKKLITFIFYRSRIGRNK